MIKQIASMMPDCMIPLEARQLETDSGVMPLGVPKAFALYMPYEPTRQLRLYFSSETIDMVTVVKKVMMTTVDRA